MRRICYIFLLGLSGITALAQPVVLSDPAQTYNLFRSSSMLEISPRSLSIDSLLHLDTRSLFVRTRNQLIRPNDQQRAYWFRVDLTNQTSSEFFLHFVYSGTERIQLYEIANGRLVSQRTMGRLVAEEREPFRYSKLIWPLQVKQGQTHTLYIYMEGIYTTALYFSAKAPENLIKTIHYEDLFYGIYYGFIAIIIIYSLLLFIRLGDKDSLLYAVWVLSLGTQLALYRGLTAEFLWSANPQLERYGSALAGLTGILHILFTITFLQVRQRTRYFYGLGLTVIATYLIGLVLLFVSVSLGDSSKRIDVIPFMALVDGVYSIAAGIVVYRKGFKPALYFIIGNFLFFVAIFIFLEYAYGQLPHAFLAYNSIHIGSGLEIILFTLALTYKVNLLKQKQDEAVREQLRLSEENRQLIEMQNQILEQKVEQRTHELYARKEELQTTLKTLQDTQGQLIQKEKMASLGQLMAGIAHEIQNPLNFVNNFAEVSVQVIGEQLEALEHGQVTEAIELAQELSPNLSRISHHGKRAASIVRAMLEHSRSVVGNRQPTDLNALATEYLTLTYQNTLAQNPDLRVSLQTELDPNLGLADVMPHEITQVLVNLYNNAFYAVQQKAQNAEPTYQPLVRITTHRLDHEIELVVQDNGTGIPGDIRHKIFQPFFTTKPTGPNIGLGLSLSYDIITKGHFGIIDLRTQPGSGTEFIIRIPHTRSDL